MMYAGVQKMDTCFGHCYLNMLVLLFLILLIPNIVDGPKNNRDK